MRVLNHAVQFQPGQAIWKFLYNQALVVLKTLISDRIQG